MSKVKVIAEIGENFIGDIAIAKKLIRAAADAGADYVKFQSYRPETFKPTDPEYEWFKKVSLSDDDHFLLRDYSKECGVKFFSAPFSMERAKFLCEVLKLKEIKIASGMMMNFDLLDYVNRYAECVFISTGMATLEEIKEAISHLKRVSKVYILHCVTQYPCEDQDANLLAIKQLQNEFPGYEIGYSDHTLGTLAPLAAAALGASVIEKHFTFDKQAKEGTDHILSVEPDELKQMVRDIRRIEKLLGNEQKIPTKGEQEITQFVRTRFVVTP